MFSFHKWIRVSILNFLIVAVCGIILRYKILFALPSVSQKYLLHAHSHFAFTGWVSQMLFCFLVYYLQKKSNAVVYTKYARLLGVNLIIAYGMLISFAIQGYGFYSITFSTLSLVINAVFAVYYWRDLNRLHDKTITAFCFKAALLFAQVSALGTFMLAGLMANKVAEQKLYIAAIYFFLHFQYNGWFLFGCLGILFMIVSQQSYSNVVCKKLCVALAISCAPAYILSLLNFSIHWVVYGLAVLAAIVQLTAMIWLLIKMKRSLRSFSSTIAWLYKIIALAVVIKFALQAFSVIPALAKLAFGSRFVVIAYLHLVLLCTVSLFLIVSVQAYMNYKKAFMMGLFVFLVGIIGNEILLAGQGIMSFTGNVINYINEMLFVMALVIFTGIAIMNYTVWNYYKKLR